MNEIEKPLSLAIKELKNNLLEEIISSNLHPSILVYALEDIRIELQMALEKTEIYELECYKKSIENKEVSKEEQVNGEN